MHAGKVSEAENARTEYATRGKKGGNMARKKAERTPTYSATLDRLTKKV